MTLTEKEFVLDTLRRAGKAAAVNLQAESPSMTGTELCATEEYIPDFQAAKAAKTCWSARQARKMALSAGPAPGGWFGSSRSTTVKSIPRSRRSCPPSGGLSGPLTRTRRCPSSPSPLPPTPKGIAVPQMAKPGAARLTPTPGPRRRTRSFGRE